MKKWMTLVVLSLFAILSAPASLERSELTGKQPIMKPIAELEMLATAYYKPLADQKRYHRGNYRKEIRFNGTGITYSGEKAEIGIIAADLEVLPLGTKVYIPDYGIGVVKDTGGRIKGNRIDLFMGEGEDALERSLDWGAKRTQIHVLHWGR